MDNQPKQNSLKDLVIKLNDRNIQRQRESGLTIYAVVGAVLYIGFELVQLTPSILKLGMIGDTIIIITIIGNASFAIGYFVMFLLGRKSSGLTKVFPKETFLSIDASLFPYIIFFGLFSVLNFYSLIHTGTMAAIYLFFGTILSLNFISPIVIKTVQWFRNRKAKLKVPEFTYLKTKQVSLVRRVLFVYGFILCGIVTVLVVGENVAMSNEQIASVTQYGMYIVGLLFGISLILDMQERRDLNSWLEEFEKEIFIKGLTDEEIKHKLEEEYFGQDFKTWAEMRMKGISEYFNVIDQKIEQLSIDLQPLVSSYESGEPVVLMINENINLRETIIKDIRQYDIDFKKQIRHLNDFSSVENTEIETLIELQNHYNRELEALGKIDMKWHELYQKIPKTNPMKVSQ
jgi:hypothetical protein